MKVSCMIAGLLLNVFGLIAFYGAPSGLLCSVIGLGLVLIGSRAGSTEQ